SVTVLSAADYQRWLSKAAPEETMAQEGRRLFFRMGCAACHGAQTHRAPPLAGLYGSTVRLQGGATVAADEDYIRESILAPRAKIVAGYAPIMPTFEGLVDEQGLQELVAYIKTLAAR